MKSISVRIFAFAVIFVGEILTIKAGNKQSIDCNYHPFVVEGKQWTCVEVDGKDGYSRYYNATYLIRGDAVIDGDSCKILWRKEDDGQYTIFRYLFERDKVVFCLYEDYRWTAYDFGMIEGSTINLDDSTTATLEYVDTLMREGELYRRLHVNLRYDSEPMHYSGKSVWIEGIGSPSGPLMSNMWHNSGTITCSIDGEVIFLSEDFDLPAWRVDDMGVKVQTVLSALNTTPIYDLQGRRIGAKPQKGLFIENGRKIMVK